MTIVVCIGVIAPAVLGYDRSVVCAPLDGIGGNIVVAVSGVAENLAGHNLAATDALGEVAAGDTAQTLAIVVYSGNSSGNVGAVIINLYAVIVLDKVLATVCTCSNSI